MTWERVERKKNREKKEIAGKKEYYIRKENGGGRSIRERKTG